MSWWRNRDTRDLLTGVLAGAMMIAETTWVDTRGPLWANALVYGAMGALVAVRRRHTLRTCLAPVRPRHLRDRARDSGQRH